VRAEKYVHPCHQRFGLELEVLRLPKVDGCVASAMAAGRGCRAVLLRLTYLAIVNVLAMLPLLLMSDRAKDVEILALRHQLTVLERQLHGERPRFAPADRAWLAALLHRLPRGVLRRIRLLVRPDTMLRWHRDLLARRHARI
jgi:hypothetical protein